LFDLAVDLRESNNLAGRMPAKVKELKAKWDKWSAEQAEPSAPDSPAKAKKAAKPNKKKTAAK
jgi:hypothetical protein